MRKKDEEVMSCTGKRFEYRSANIWGTAEEQMWLTLAKACAHISGPGQVKESCRSLKLMK